MLLKRGARPPWKVTVIGMEVVAGSVVDVEFGLVEEEIGGSEGLVSVAVAMIRRRSEKSQTKPVMALRDTLWSTVWSI